MISDAQGRVEYTDPKFTEVTGYTIDEVVATNLKDWGRHSPQIEQLMWDTINTGLEWHGELLNVKKNGEFYWEAASISSLKDAAGTITHLIKVAEDVTERKLAERLLREKNEQLDAQNEKLRAQTEELMVQQMELVRKTKEAEEANRLKSEFLASMSHELRTPLNVIIGFSELMQDGVTGELNQEQRQCLDDVTGSGKHLLELIDEVLDLSKIESGKMRLRLGEVDLSEVIASLGSTIMPIITPKKQRLELVVEPDLPLVIADEAKIRQVLLNLLSNATKFTPNGGKLMVKAARHYQWCQVSVIDNGVGIRQDDQDKIFEAFYRVDVPIARDRVGTGLGLAVARQIIEKQGGQLWVESEYGKGSQFHFTLPLVLQASPIRGGGNNGQENTDR